MDYNEMSVVSLKAECKKRGIGTAQKRKSELVELLRSHPDTGAPKSAGESSDASGRKTPHADMSEEERIDARRTRFGSVQPQATPIKRTEHKAPEKKAEKVVKPQEPVSEGERLKIEERRRRFGAKDA